MVRTTHVLLNPFDDTGKLPDDDGIESDSSLATDDASSVDLSEEATDNSEDEGSNEGERNTNADDVIGLSVENQIEGDFECVAMIDCSLLG